jgi:hypothetical protein
MMDDSMMMAAIVGISRFKKMCLSRPIMCKLRLR